MQFKVTKVVIAKTGEARGLTKLLFILLLIFLMLLLLAASLVIIPVVLIGSMFKQKPSKEIPASRDEEISLLTGNDKVSVYTVPDENNQELIRLTEAWSQEVEMEYVEVYRAHTNPRVENLHGRFITSFVKETTTGVFLQVVEMNEHATNKISSKLVFLNYANQTVADVVDVGPYMLHNDKNSEWLVKGYNQNDQIELSLSYRND